MLDTPKPSSRLLALASLVALLLLGLPALAAEGDYQPYSPGAGTENVSAPLFVVIAYSAIWLVLIGFVVVVWRQQREVQRELDRLSKELGGASGGDR